MPIGIAYYYYQAKQNSDKTREQVAVETLVGLAKQQRAEAAQRKKAPTHKN